MRTAAVPGVVPPVAGGCLRGPPGLEVVKGLLDLKALPPLLAEVSGRYSLIHVRADADPNGVELYTSFLPKGVA